MYRYGDRPLEPQQTPASAVFVDQQISFIEGVAQRLMSDCGIQTTSYSAGLDSVLPALRRSPPRLVILEKAAAVESASSLTSLPTVREGYSRIVVLTDQITDAQLETVLRIPASGVLLKSSPLAQLVDEIRKVAAGGVRLSAAIEERIDWDAKHEHCYVRRRTVLHDLTLRQLQVLKQLALGGSVKEVARMVNLSERAVESHKYRIMKKLDIHDRVELALFAVREGLISA